MEEEEFHASYRIFVEALHMLTQPPIEQCAAMGDYNVAWELKDDVQNGKFLLQRGRLSSEQEIHIGALVRELDAAPAQSLPAGAGREINLRAMNHPSWIPLRVMARQVLKTLEPQTKTNAKVLGLPWPIGSTNRS